MNQTQRKAGAEKKELHPSTIKRNSSVIFKSFFMYKFNSSAGNYLALKYVSDILMKLSYRLKFLHFHPWLFPSASTKNPCCESQISYHIFSYSKENLKLKWPQSFVYIVIPRVQYVQKWKLQKVLIYMKYSCGCKTPLHFEPKNILYHLATLE